MSIHATRKRTAQLEARCPGDREAERLLALLEHDHDRALTIAELRARGVEAPAQAIYALQLAGYEIDRVAANTIDPQQRGYRLRTPAQYLNGRSGDLSPAYSDES